MEKNRKRQKASKKSITALLVCSAVIISVTAADFFMGAQKTEETSMAMGTIINMTIYGSDGKETAEAVKNDISSVEKALLSKNIESSDVGRINKNAGKPVSVSKDTLEVISKSADVSGNCGGVFDITIGNVTKLWDFGGENQRLPSENEIKSALKGVDSKKILITGTEVRTDKNQTLDLGAVGKGFACDHLKNLLSSTRTKSAVVSVGGSLLLYGKKSFTIGIVNPFDDKTAMGTLKLSDTCVSTSGDYEKYFQKDGKLYHHILDANTGYPADTALKSVTIVSESGLISDALSTACFVLGYFDSLKLLEIYDAEAVFIFKDKTVRCTDGLKEAFTLKDNSFVVGK